MTSDSVQERRYTFKKKEILRGKRAFTYLFEHGASFRRGVLKFHFVVDPPEDLVPSRLTVAFSVPKRLFKRASDRNLLKRRLREAFRLNKDILLPSLQRNQQSLVFLVVYNRPFPIPYQALQSALKSGLYQLKQELESIEKTTDPTD